MADKKPLASIAKSVGLSLVVDEVAGIIRLAKAMSSCYLVISNNERSFETLNKIIYNFNKETYNKFRVPIDNESYYELVTGAEFFIRINKYCFIKVTSYETADKNYYEKKLRIDFYGKKKEYYRNKIFNKIISDKSKKRIKFEVLSSDYRGTLDVPIHSFNNIVIDESVKNNIVNGLINWWNDRQWYKDHQLIHKIGVFLYGQPGTGKSTIAKAISTMFNNAPICMLDISRIGSSIDRLIFFRRKYSGVIVVLIEDFDMIFKNREDDDDEYDEDGSPIKITTKSSKSSFIQDITQNTIFQVLDGIYSMDDIIFVATTNYKERIDPALIRYGRFDIQEELKYFDKEKASLFVKNLGYTDTEKVLSDLGIEYPVQPSFLQSKIMEYRVTNK